MKKLATALLMLTWLLGIATNASAQDPYWGPNESVNITATGTSKLTIVDHESVGANEVKTSYLSGISFGKVGGWSPFPNSFKHVLSRCAGNEVRAELHVEAQTTPTSRFIFMKVYLDLFEGSDCGTTDFDGYSPYVYFQFKPGQSVTKTISATNTAEGGDSATATVTFFAKPVI